MSFVLALNCENRKPIELIDEIVDIANLRKCGKCGYDYVPVYVLCVIYVAAMYQLLRTTVILHTGPRRTS